MEPIMDKVPLCRCRTGMSSNPGQDPASTLHLFVERWSCLVDKGKTLTAVKRQACPKATYSGCLAVGRRAGVDDFIVKMDTTYTRRRCPDTVAAARSGTSAHSSNRHGRLSSSS
ncbi:hypothetical protein FALBO_12733 [Fusarium albosuccineum]|uniref:Uncharacterized protein n=1 Tax=Fusarium albosuccineum TaxID=1237068 RepID=A0A8H4P610_9HYPO|nr:hypothetical protein FALBO_12733 [Fusarium albosuccineum]